MQILKDRKRLEIKDMFNTSNDLIKYIGNTNDKINTKSEIIIKSINKLYNKMINDEGVIKFSRFSRWYPKELGFKKKNVLQLDFWLERGWSGIYGKNRITDIMIERANKAKETKNVLKNKIVINGIEKYKYKMVEFESEIRPHCNCCGYELILKKVNINNKKTEYFFQIESCSNNKCISHEMNKTGKYKAYLPKDVSENKLKELNEIINKSNRLCIDYWVSKGLNVDEAKYEISKIQSSNSKLVKNRFVPSKENLKEIGFSDEEIREICLTPTSIKFWLNKGFTIDEAKIKISENQSNAVKYVDYEKRLLPSNIEYWVERGYNYEQSRLKVSEHQTTFSRDICIDKYGNEEGIKRFIERQNKWLSNYTRNNFSKISQELFWGIIETGELINDEVYFATYKNGDLDNSGTNNEYRLKLNYSFILPDFFVKNKNKIIEFDATYYHRPTPENLLRESIRDTNIIESGYEVFHVSEFDYKNNKQKVIDKCLEFLNKK